MEKNNASTKIIELRQKILLLEKDKQVLDKLKEDHKISREFRHMIIKPKFD